MSTGPGGFLQDRDGWRQRANCRGSDPEMFFPMPLDHEAQAAAKAICATCPVIRPCLEFAIRSNSSAGVFGNTTESERDHMLRQQRIAEQEMAEVAS